MWLHERCVAGEMRRSCVAGVLRMMQLYEHLTGQDSEASSSPALPSCRWPVGSAIQGHLQCCSDERQSWRRVQGQRRHLKSLTRVLFTFDATGLDQDGGLAASMYSPLIPVRRYQIETWLSDKRRTATIRLTSLAHTCHCALQITLPCDACTSQLNCHTTRRNVSRSSVQCGSQGVFGL